MVGRTGKLLTRIIRGMQNLGDTVQGEHIQIGG